MLRTTLATTAVSLLIGVMFALCSPELVAQQKTTKEDIAKAWHNRQQRVKSARFVWTEQQTIVRGSISDDWKVFQPKLNQVIPPNDTTFSDQREVSFDGRKLRYAFTRRDWIPSKSDFASVSYLSVFDGATCNLLTGSTPDREFQQGQVRAESHHIEYANLHLQAILLNYRATEPRMRTYDLNDFDLVRIRTMIGSIPCLELLQSLPNEIENRLWIDQSRGFVLVRAVTVKRGVIKHKLDVAYLQDVEKEWVPHKWQISFNTPDGRLNTHYQARVLSYELNQPIDNEEFKMTFPAGTWVKDEKQQIDWIVKPDGSGKRSVARSEFATSYAQLINTASPNSMVNLWTSSTNWATIGGMSLVVAGLLLAFFFRRRTIMGRH